MTLRERFEKLEPRERRLLTILGSILGVLLFLAAPIGIITMVSHKRSDNQDIRDRIDQIYESRNAIADRKAKKDAIVARYRKPAPPLAGYIEEAFKENGASAAESQDRPEAPHGKLYSERMTVVKVHKIQMLQLAKTLEKIEQSGNPVVVSKLNIKPRSGEADSFEVELGVSAYDRKAAAPIGAGSASPAASAAPDKEKDL